MQTPSGVHSHVQWHIAKLHWQTQIPFIRQFTEQSPSQSDLQRFCNVAQASSSSQTQCSFAPPAHFSTRIVQRGTISVLPVVAAGLAAADIPGRHAVPTDRSSIIIPAIPGLLFGGGGPVGADIPRRVPPVDPDLRRGGVGTGSNAREGRPWTGRSKRVVEHSKRVQTAAQEGFVWNSRIATAFRGWAVSGLGSPFVTAGGLRRLGKFRIRLV